MMLDDDDDASDDDSDADDYGYGMVMDYGDDDVD